MTPWLFALFLAAAAASDPAVHIHHRVRLDGETAPFTPKGTVLLAPSGPSYAPVAAFRQDIAAWSKSSSPGARYEVALQTDGDPEDWPRSSVKLCHVTGAPEELITIHKTTAGDIFALDYLLASVPRDGTCPTKPALLYLASADVQLKSPTPAFAPRLKTPPPLGPDGQAIKPVPEQSFIQKYWIYIVPALIIMLVLPAGPEEGPQQ